jgi:hypothetical protein
MELEIIQLSKDFNSCTHIYKSDNLIIGGVCYCHVIKDNNIECNHDILINGVMYPQLHCNFIVHIINELNLTDEICFQQHFIRYKDRPMPAEIPEDLQIHIDLLKIETLPLK